MSDITPEFAYAIGAVLGDYRQGKLTSRAAVAALAFGMDDDPAPLDVRREGFDQATLDLVNLHIKNIQENRA
jgi:hypothetical protein